MIDESFAIGDSILHRTDPRIKIIGSCCIIGVIALSQSLVVATFGLLVAVFLTIFARLPIRSVGRRLVAVQVFLIFLWLILPLSMDGSPIFFGLSREGILLSLLITVKSNAIVLLTITLLTTSSIQAIGQGLRRLHCPLKLILLLLFTYRYLFVIANECHKLRRAARLRCFRPDTSMHTYRTYGYLIGMTLVRSWERAGRIQNAMVMRGFNGYFPQVDLLKLRFSDWLVFSGLGAVAFMLLLLN